MGKALPGRGLWGPALSAEIAPTDEPASLPGRSPSSSALDRRSTATHTLLCCFKLPACQRRGSSVAGLLYISNPPSTKGPLGSAAETHATYNTTSNGGSLGSWVDEDRSKMRVGM